MLSFVQHLGRICKANQGRDALLQLLFISDLSADEKARHAEDAKITCARLKENGLVGDAKEFIANPNPNPNPNSTVQIPYFNTVTCNFGQHMNT
jgi:hypothetical protein